MERLENMQGSNSFMDGSLLREAKKSVGRFIYESGMEFNVVQSPHFQRMIFHDFGLTTDKIPTCQELKGWVLKDVKEDMLGYVNEMRKSWATTGCSVLLDGWKDARGQSLINVLVDCPRGTIYLRSFDISSVSENLIAKDNPKLVAMKLLLDNVINYAGVKNVVQIVTYSTSPFMKVLGEEVMKKYRQIFWTVGISTCIELMLEKMGKIDLIRETLDKTKTIERFIHNHRDVLHILKNHTGGHDLSKTSKIMSAVPFLNLENIVLEEKNLKKLFLSSNSESAFLTSTPEGQMVAELVGSVSFWSSATVALKAAIPLVRVMKWMDENRAQMGYIYETIDQAKETIKDGFKKKKSVYEPFWKPIDDVWEDHLYSPLHSLGYFLNPNLFYSTDLCIDPEVTTGLLFSIVRASNDLQVLDAITHEMEKYRKANGSFSIGCMIDARSGVPPALWWSVFGGECPHLQQLAVRILDQTCDSAPKFQLKRSLVEDLYASGENQTDQQRLHDMIFLHYNLQLQSIGSGKSVSFF